MNRVAATVTLAVSLSLAASACSSSPTTLGSDPSANIGNYRTYQWITQPEADYLKLKNPRIEFLAGSSDVVRKPEIEARARRLIEEGLQSRGLKPAEDGHPDFYVTFYSKAHNDNWVSSWQGNTTSINNTPLVIFPGYSREQAFSTRDGDVYITFYDSRSQKPSWVGRMTGDEVEPSLSHAQVQASVRDLFKEFKVAA